MPNFSTIHFSTFIDSLTTKITIVDTFINYSRENMNNFINPLQNVYNFDIVIRLTHVNNLSYPDTYSHPVDKLLT